MNKTDFIWCEKYRPHTVQDTILPKSLKALFQQFVDQKEIPNLLLCGSAGVGKTTVAKAMLDEMNADYITINGSMNGNIDTLRYDISKFASTVSFGGGRKYVILDEADYINPNSTQPALRNFMEEFSKNCGFILTCNFKNKIIEPLHSRCSVIDFKIPKKEMPKLASEFFNRVTGILKKEDITFKPATIGEIVKLYFPDFRRTLNELQRHASLGYIPEDALSQSNVDDFDTLFDLMKQKNFTQVRTWVGENSDIDSSVLYRKLYDMLPVKVKSTSSVAEGIITLAQYQYQEAFVASPEINRVACLATIMADCDWK